MGTFDIQFKRVSSKYLFIKIFVIGLLLLFIGLNAYGQSVGIDINFGQYPPGDDSVVVIQDTIIDDYIEVANSDHDTLNGHGGGITEISGTTWDYNPAQTGVGYDSLIVYKNNITNTDTLVITVLPRIEFDTTFSVCNNDPDFALTHALDTPGGGSIYYYDNNNAVVNGRFYPDSVVSGIYNVFINDTIYDNGSPFIGRDTTTVTVTDPPSAYDLLPSDTSFCQGVGDQGVEIWLSENEDGVNYVLEKDGTPVDTVTGDGLDTLTFSGIYQEGTYTAYAYTGSCTNTMNGTAEVSVITPDYPHIKYFSDSIYCEGGKGVELGLDDTEQGVDYYLIHDDTDTVNYISGTGSSESLGFHTDTSGYYSLDMTNGLCVITNEDTMKVYSNPKPEAYFLSGPDGYCEGSSATLELDNSDDSVTYTLYREYDGNSFGTRDGTGSPLTWSVSDTGTFYVMAVNDSTGCEGMMDGKVTLEKYPLPDVTTSSDTAICPGTSAEIWADGGETYRWNTGETLSDSTVSNPIASPDSNTEYTVTVTDSNGCSNTGDILVEVVEPPTVNAGPEDTSFCYGDSITLSGAATANSLPVDGYYWEDVDSSKSVTIGSAPKGYHVFQAWDTKGCVNTDTIDVTVKTNPTANASDAEICEGETAILTVTATAVTSIASYEWSTGSTNSYTIVSPSSSRDYTVTVTDNNGCSATDISSVTVYDNPSVSVDDTSICPGDTATLEAFALDGDGGPYSYSWNTGETTQSIEVSPNSDEKFYVTASDSNCSDTDSSNVAVKSLPDINISGLDSSYCNDVTGFTFHATPDSGFYSSPWSDSDIFEDRGDGEAYFNPSNVSDEDTFNIKYEAVGSNTCSNDTTMQVEVNFIPNVNFFRFA